MTKQFKSRKEKYNFWKNHIHNWQQSNISQAEYCRCNHLKTKSFRYFKSRIARQSNSQISLIPVTVQANPIHTTEPDVSLGLVLLNGLKIEVADGFNPSTLKKLISTAEAV